MIGFGTIAAKKCSRLMQAGRAACRRRDGSPKELLPNLIELYWKPYRTGEGLYPGSRYRYPGHRLQATNPGIFETNKVID